MAKAGRLGLGVIGAGAVGPVLAAAWAGAGHQLLGLHARSPERHDSIAAMIPDVRFLSIAELVERSELVVLAVPANELAALVQSIADQGLWQPGQLVAHTAAEFGTEVLHPAIEAGVIPLAIHPAMSFSGTSLDLGRLKESWCAVTAPAPVLPIAQALVVELGAEPVVIDEEDRPIYAEAIDTAKQFSTALVNQSKALLAGIGVERPGRVLDQVFRSAVDLALGETVRDTADFYGFVDDIADDFDSDAER
ncbi:MAG: DUF2520 domain-containing protein [Microbacteriaceae bacterium]